MVLITGNELNSMLKHYGILGQRWGVRRTRAELRKMSDAQLKNALERLKIEDEFIRLLDTNNQRLKSQARKIFDKELDRAADKVIDDAIKATVSKFISKGDKNEGNHRKPSIKDTSSVTAKDLQNAIDWYGKEKKYQEAKAEYESRQKKKKDPDKPNDSDDAKNKEK